MVGPCAPDAPPDTCHVLHATLTDGFATHQVVQEEEGIHHVDFTANRAPHDEPCAFSLAMGCDNPSDGARATAWGSGVFFGLKHIDSASVGTALQCQAPVITQSHMRHSTFPDIAPGLVLDEAASTPMSAPVQRRRGHFRQVVNNAAAVRAWQTVHRGSAGQTTQHRASKLFLTSSSVTQLAQDGKQQRHQRGVQGANLVKFSVWPATQSGGSAVGGGSAASRCEL